MLRSYFLEFLCLVSFIQFIICIFYLFTSVCYVSQANLLLLVDLSIDYETLRALDADNVPTAASMSEEEINTLPVHKYKVSGSQRYMSKINYLNIREYSNITFPISVSTESRICITYPICIWLFRC